ncbi:MAG: biotin--[acetyl-CoA-carboxylase] ligase [Desulfobacca sp.]|nr:biotin--[acetyl-CoA-carboxylase] ligase [Desulfobacca sp.]
MENPEKSGRNLKKSILKALAQGEVVSGERLSRELNVSRPAVWKNIGQLKQDGFTIESRRGKGYCLKAVPDVLYPDLIRQELGPCLFGQKIIHFPRTDSTNIQARILAAEGALEGTLVVAEYQEKGKGRLKRIWQSPPGKNLLFSLILRPDWPPQQAFFGTVLASVSLCRAIQETAGINVHIKWPNDIYAGEKKIAGILTEFTTDPDRIEYMIIGVGVNCHWAPLEPPSGGLPATSLFTEGGKKISRLHLLTRFLRQGDACYQRVAIEGVGFLREEWNRYSLVNNRKVTLISHQTSWTGVAQGIDEQGGLILRLEDGRLETFLAGDVHLRF